MRKLSDIRAAPTRPQANAIVAAATMISREALTNALGWRKNTRTAAEWQAVAWEHYETCGELRFAAEWLGNSLSRAKLFAGRLDGPTGKVIPVPGSDPAAVAMTTLCGGHDGQSEMLKRLGPHLTVPGESYLVGWDDAATGRQNWATLCNDEIEESVPAGTVTILWQGEKIDLPADALIIRIWRPHPRMYWEANSPVRGLEMILNELYKLTQHVSAQADSRLAGAGLLVLPLETTFPPPPGEATETTDDDPTAAATQGLSGFMRTLAASMVTPIANRDDASAVVPVVVQAPGDQIKNVRHISFATPLSQEAMSLRQEAIRRLAAGLDMPSEILTGLGGSNHWTAWQIDESSVKTHIEPILQLICNALTVCYLRPIMGEDPDDSDLVVGYDASELKQRPDRSAIAKDLYSLGELSGDALRREAGFDDSDAPTTDDDRRAILRSMIDRAAIDTQTAVEICVLLGYVSEGDLSAAPVPGDSIGSGDQGDAANPSPAEDPKALPVRPEDPPADDQRDVPAASLGERARALAVEMGGLDRRPVVIGARALLAGHVMDYAGKRLLARAGRAHRGRYPDLPASALHTRIPVGPEDLDPILDGAYSAFPRLDPRLRASVDVRVRAALLAGEVLDPATLAGPDA